MPNIQSAKKALRQTKKRTLHNRSIKNTLKLVIKKTQKSIANKKLDEARAFLKQSQKLLDKASKIGVIKKNTASRKKSRLTVIFNALTK